jgi:hypothetical protein
MYRPLGRLSALPSSLPTTTRVVPYFRQWQPLSVIATSTTCSARVQPMMRNNSTNTSSSATPVTAATASSFDGAHTAGVINHDVGDTNVTPVNLTMRPEFHGRRIIKELGISHGLCLTAFGGDIT